jgi:hypothetical protein
MAGVTVYVMEKVGYRVGRSEGRDPVNTIFTAICWWFCLFVIVPTTLAYKGMIKQEASREERRRRWQKQEAETVDKE